MHFFGTLTGLMNLISFQLLGSFIFVYAYDRSDKDIFNISAVKEKFLERWDTKKDDFRRSAFGKSLLFLLYTWKFMPPMVLILLRSDGKKGQVYQEIMIVTASIAVATAYSALVSLGLFSLPGCFRFCAKHIANLFGSP
ncbi:MAG: hypothetical protein NTZ38_01200 [Candidatus Taylorbacteria bacterium]|nr:hypothetical protein [Candidatus Taylorbacteria bacterium]